jgi:hypothetical protein
MEGHSSEVMKIATDVVKCNSTEESKANTKTLRGAIVCMRDVELM